MEIGSPEARANLERMQAIDAQLSHVWMVRAFLKHSDEAAEDEELASVHRDLYDYMLALGPSLQENDPDRYLKMARKKLRRLRRASELFHEIQPEVSGHTNFIMANRSLRIAVERIAQLLHEGTPTAMESFTEEDEASDDDMEHADPKT
jgi:tRNA A37 N6-isopentenylltransferase MiaA